MSDYVGTVVEAHIARFESQIKWLEGWLDGYPEEAVEARKAIGNMIDVLEDAIASMRSVKSPMSSLDLRDREEGKLP